MKTESWCGHDIRFVEINSEWWAILKDICDALDLRTDKVASRLDPDMLERVRVECNHLSKGVRLKARKTQDILAINEIGIKDCIMQSVTVMGGDVEQVPFVG